MACKVLCEPCLYVEQETEAVGFCFTCAECLCPKCVLEHRKAKMTRNHSIQQDSIPENVEIIKGLNEMLACQVHMEMKIAYRCCDHSVCVCSLCRVDNHRNCDNVFEIAKAAYQDRDLSKLHESLTELEESASAVRNRKEENKTTLYQNKNQVLDEQESIIQQAIAALEELKVQYRKKTDEQLQVALSEVDQDIEAASLTEKNTVKNREILEVALKHGDDKSRKIIVHLLADTVVKHGDLVSELKQKKDLKLKFERNENCITVSTLGTTSVMRGEADKSEAAFEFGIEKTSDEIPESCASNLFVDKPLVNSSSHSLPTIKDSFLTHKKQICVRSEIDRKPCSILGSVLLSDGHLVIIDNDNSNIKLLSSDLTLLDILRLPGKPVRMCAIGNDNVAVSFERVKRINRYVVEGSKISYEGGFPTSLFNHGIAFDGRNIVSLMSDLDFASRNNAKDNTIHVEVMNPNYGNISDVIRDFKVVGNKSWSLVLNNTQAILYLDVNTIVIAELNRILRFRLVKESTQTVALEEQFYVCSGEIPKDDIENIASDRESIFACAASGSILQICASDYNKHRVILSDIGEDVSSIAVDSKNNRIILGYEEQDNIYVYTFQKGLSSIKA